MKIPLLTFFEDCKNMVVFTLTLIRHGETAHNKDNVIQGQLDVPLSQTGLHQAELLGSYLQHQQFSHVYVSDLTRAMQTAECIIKQNKSFSESLLQDERLRERKFGIVEGKSFKFLREVAGKSNQKVGQYTPPGGETIQQVHERAVSFFNDLCEMVKEKNSSLESQKDIKISSNGSGHTENANIIGSEHTENANIIGQKRKWENDSDKGQNTEESPNRFADKILSASADKCKEHGSLSLQSCKNVDQCITEKNRSDDCEKTNCCGAVDKNKQTISSKCENLNDRAPVSVTFTDDDISTQSRSSGSDLPNIECPNVSLSPLMDRNLITSSLLCKSVHNQSSKSDLHLERRLSVCSSCDDADSCPTIAANILVVSHGGLLRELFRYFVEDLECTVPGGKNQALCISPNAGLSKFTVSVDPVGQPKIICLQIHDKQHLTPSLYKDYILNSDDTAL